MAEPAKQTHQLTDLTDFIRRVFALNLPQPVWVAAEIGQANLSRDHVWLTLVQKDPAGSTIVARLDGVVWKRQLTKLQRAHGIKLVRELFQDGMSVRLKVTTAYHARYGLRLVVEDIDPGHTLGDLEQRRRETLARLSKEGLLGKNATQALSTTPLNLAVISSDTAAGLADFRDQLAANPYGYQFDLRLFPAAMQGAQTGPEITSRLNQIRSWGEAFDAVVIVRGGGGRTDLRAFDDEDLARLIADYHLPVITGIGHETDDAVVDRVAHTALKTPTAAAVFLIDRVTGAEAHLLQLSRQAQQLVTNTLYQLSPRLQQLQQAIGQRAENILLSETNRLDAYERELVQEPTRALGDQCNRIDGLEKLLTALRPETTLARGFAMVIQDGQLVTSPTEIATGEVEVRLKSGRVRLRKDD